MPGLDILVLKSVESLRGLRHWNQTSSKLKVKLTLPSKSLYLPLIFLVYLTFSGFSSGHGFSIKTEFLSGINEKLLDFGKLNAENKGNEIVLLKWITLKEYDTHKFIIERSKDKKDFELIGQLGASQSSPIPISYNFSDLSPLEGQCYYRIKAVNREGQSQYSSSLAISFEADYKGLQLLQAFPNPFQDSVRISYSLPADESLDICLFTAEGKEITCMRQASTQGNNTLVLRPDSLSGGRYILGLMGKDKTLKAVELIKK